jgi:hypothetical protein
VFSATNVHIFAAASFRALSLFSFSLVALAMFSCTTSASDDNDEEEEDSRNSLSLFFSWPQYDYVPGTSVHTWPPPPPNGFYIKSYPFFLFWILYIYANLTFTSSIGIA